MKINATDLVELALESVNEMRVLEDDLKLSEESVMSKLEATQHIRSVVSLLNHTDGLWREAVSLHRQEAASCLDRVCGAADNLGAIYKVIKL